jgi:hypothetical protein
VLHRDGVVDDLPSSTAWRGHKSHPVEEGCFIVLVSQSIEEAGGIETYLAAVPSPGATAEVLNSVNVCSRPSSLRRKRLQLPLPDRLRAVGVPELANNDYRWLGPETAFGRPVEAVSGVRHGHPKQEAASNCDEDAIPTCEIEAENDGGHHADSPEEWLRVLLLIT